MLPNSSFPYYRPSVSLFPADIQSHPLMRSLFLFHSLSFQEYSNQRPLDGPNKFGICTRGRGSSCGGSEVGKSLTQVKYSPGGNGGPVQSVRQLSRVGGEHQQQKEGGREQWSLSS